MTSYKVGGLVALASLTGLLVLLPGHAFPGQSPDPAHLSAMAQMQSIPDLRTELAFEARISVGAPLVIPGGPDGLRRVIPITGGSFQGPNIRGRVVPGGADWQYVRGDGAISLEAKYTLETDDGVLIMITNGGLRRASPAVMDRLSRGEVVDPSEYYFRTVATFEAPRDSGYAWLNDSIFIGVAARLPDAAVVRFYRVM